MKYAYDLHLHTALSPCADDDMTPNNVVNMAMLKGLAIIAITDHNSVANCKACMKVGAELPILVIPGMELQTKEDVHVLCYFPNLEKAQAFGESVEQYRLALPNKPNKFGNQILMNEKDDNIGEYPYALITSLDITLDQVVKLVVELNGVVVPAHLDRPSNSILSNLGFMPPELKVKTVEVSKRTDKDTFISKNPMMKSYNIMQSSDAHTLADIAEPDQFIDIEGDLTIQSVLDKIRG